MSDNGHNPLTARQTELLGWVASGLTIEQAAKKCYIATQSAYNILSSARNRADVHTVAQLAVIAVQRRLARDGRPGQLCAPADHSYLLTADRPGRGALLRRTASQHGSPAQPVTQRPGYRTHPCSPRCSG